MKREGEGQYHDVDPAPAACPKCGKTVDSCTKIKGGEDRGPREGDLSICFYCTSVLMYVDDRFLREAEPEEIPQSIARLAERLQLAKERPHPVILVGRIG